MWQQLSQLEIFLESKMHIGYLQFGVGRTSDFLKSAGVAFSADVHDSCDKTKAVHLIIHIEIIPG